MAKVRRLFRSDVGAHRIFRANKAPARDDFQPLRLRGGEELESDKMEDEDDDENPDGDEEDDLAPRRRRNGIRPANDAPVSNNDFEPGAIVRVRVENFVTYEYAEFYPGGRLNMIIGPNGTGKSSLVCAICLGLGFPTNVMGRASTYGEFVKHGMDFAVVEIELKKRPEDAENHVFRLRINQEDNSRKFWINGRESPLKAVSQLVRSLRIQVDNLCQFLPQDRVAEFAGLNPVELLTRTLQAAAPPEMSEWQSELKKNFSDCREIEREFQNTAEELKKLESRQQVLQADVDKLREREEIQKNIALLEKARIYRHYTDVRRQYSEARVHMKEAERNLKALEESCAPALEAVNQKQEYSSQVQVAAQARVAALRQAEAEADDALKAVESAEGKLRSIETRMTAEAESFATAKRNLAQTRKRMTDLEAQHKQAPRPFDASEWNTRIREQEHLMREKVDAGTELDEQITLLRNQKGEKAAELRRVKEQLQNLDSKEGALEHQLERLSPDVAKGWKWLQENQNQFQKPIFGPPMLSCIVKDRRYSDLVQSLLSEEDFLCFTTQTVEDHKKLQDRFYGSLKISVTIRNAMVPYSSFRHPMPLDRLREMGLDGYVSDYLEGPEPVLAMLCGRKGLHTAGIGVNEISEAQFEQLQAAEALPLFVAANKAYRVSRRKEYGPDAVSTRVTPVSRGQFWTDAPVDTTEKEGLRRRVAELTSEMQDIEADSESKRAEKDRISKARDEISDKIKTLRNEKAELQKEFTKWQSLPDRIEAEKRSEKKMIQDVSESKKRQEAHNDGKDDVLLERVTAILRHQKKLSAIRDCYQALIEAQIRHVEAKSDVKALEAKNAEIHKRLGEERNNLQELQGKVQSLRQAASGALAEVQSLVMDEEEKQEVCDLADAGTAESISSDIDSEKAKLEVIQANNPHALEEFESRALEIQRSQKRRDRAQVRLEEIKNTIDELRGRWEPRLDELVGQINEAFSYNFEQISCAGEVSVHKDEDFDKWAMEIRVRFRENETLQKLDQHRQSGGERAVSTIFYLMSLQSMAQAPFRVVDEINQGMDPRNERMVHERMVEIACREHTSQYFLFTPKLLSGLHYDEGMRVLCIASGPEMPVDGAKRVDFRKIAEMQRQLMASVRQNEVTMTV